MASGGEVQENRIGLSRLQDPHIKPEFGFWFGKMADLHRPEEQFSQHQRSAGNQFRFRFAMNAIGCVGTECPEQYLKERQEVVEMGDRREGRRQDFLQTCL